MITCAQWDVESRELDRFLRFEKPATDERLRQRERNRIPKKTRQNPAWAINEY